jgi:hypothetical protein
MRCKSSKCFRARRRLLAEQKFRIRSSQSLVVARWDGPHESIKEARPHFYNILALHSKSLGYPQRTNVLRVNERNHARHLQYITGIVKNAARGLTRVALSPATPMKRISEFPLKYDLGIRGGLITLIPAPRDCGYACTGFHRQVAQSAASDQRAIRFAQHSELPQREVLVSPEDGLKPGDRFLRRPRLAVPEVSRYLWISMELNEEFEIRRVDPPQCEPLGLDPVGIARKSHIRKLKPYASFARV